MKFPLCTRRSAIGIDVGGHCINAVQVRRATGKGGGWKIEAALQLPSTMPLDINGVDRLRQVLLRQSFRGNDVVLAVPGHKLMTAVLDLPPRDSGAPLDQIAKTELAQAYDVKPHAFEMACWDLPTPQRGTQTGQVMTVGCAHADANETIDLFASAGLRVRGLDTKSWAFTRVANLDPTHQDGIVAMIDIERYATLLALVYRNVVLYARVVTDFSFDHLRRDLSKMVGDKLSMVQYILEHVGLKNNVGVHPNKSVTINLHRRIATFFDQIVRDIDECLVYSSRQYPDIHFDKLVLTGDGATIPGLVEHFAEALNVHVVAPMANDIVPCAADLVEICNSAALLPALGLAMFPGREAA